jgi:hypothetical protein
MAAGVSRLFAARWRWRSQQLRPHQQQAEQNGGQLFHKFISAARRCSCLEFRLQAVSRGIHPSRLKAELQTPNHFFSVMSAARIFFRYLAWSLSKSFLHPGQHNLTSWP